MSKKLTETIKHWKNNYPLLYHHYVINAKNDESVALHHSAYKKNYKKYILNAIEIGINGEPLKTDQQKIDYIWTKFNSESFYLVKKIGLQKAIADWLSGLALNIAYYDQDIIDLAIDMGSIDEKPSDKLKAKVIDNYFNFMANIILTELNSPYDHKIRLW